MAAEADAVTKVVIYIGPGGVSMMVETLFILLALTVWMGEEVEVHVVNVLPTEAECARALAVETQYTNSLPHCCGGAATLRCFA